MSITAYVKPTNYCNVGCTHCYLTENVRADRFVMHKDVLTKTGETIEQMRKAMRRPGALVIWHGGEPLVLQPDWFEEACNHLAGLIEGVAFSMQTSLIPYQRTYAPLVRKWFGSQIGSSLDFTQRQIKGSVEEYHKLWLQKLDLAREDGFLVVPGIVPSVFEVDKTRYILDFCRRHDLRVVNIDRFNAYGAAYLGWPTNAQHSQFLINLFDDLMRDMETHGNAALIMVIAAAIRGVVQGVPGDRWGGTCQSDFIVIEPDGSLNNCPDKTSHDAAYGYAQDGYDAFAKNSLRRKSIKIQQILHKRDHCITCMYNTWCKSGCPITPNGPQDGQDECAGYKRFLDHVRMVYATESGKAVVDAYMRQKGPRLVNGVYGTFDDTAEGLAVQRSA